MPFVNDVYWLKAPKSERLTHKIVNAVYPDPIPEEVSNIIHNYFSSACDYNFDNDNLWHGKYPIIVDNSSTIKAGFSNDDNNPRKTFPCLIGRSRDADENKEILIGDEAVNKKGLFSLKCPIEDNVVTNWDDMEKIWYHTFHSKLSIKPKDHAILLTEPPLNLKYNREKMVEIMTEYFNFPSIYIANQSVLALYSSGFTTGLVCDSGEHATYIVPVDEGFAVNKATKKLDIGGRDVTKYLIKLLSEHGYAYAPTHDASITEIKESWLYVAQDYQKELQATKTSDDNKKTYELPDGDIVATVNHERVQCPEILFQPKMVEAYSRKGIHQLCYQAIMQCNQDTRQHLFRNVVLSGGNTMFTGIETRLSKELVKLSQLTANDINVVAPSQRRTSTWTGGALLSSLSTFQDSWITSDDYDEFGASIVHRKCI